MLARDSSNNYLREEMTSSDGLEQGYSPFVIGVPLEHTRPMMLTPRKRKILFSHIKHRVPQFCCH